MNNRKARPARHRTSKIGSGLLLLGFAAVVLPGRTQAPSTTRSPEVQSDKRVTFRLRAPNAKEVFLNREGTQRVAMQKDERGSGASRLLRWNPTCTATPLW